MNDLKTEKPLGKIEISAEEARGARLGRPVLYVLIGTIIGAVVAVFVVLQAV